MASVFRLFGFTSVLALLCVSTPTFAAPKVAKPAHFTLTEVQIAKAKALNDRILTLDTHLDTPVLFPRPGWDIMDRHDVATGLSQVDYPRMLDGGLSGGFFVIYTPQGPLTPEGFAGARDAALKRGMDIREMLVRHPDHFELATSSTDATRIKAAGKRVVFMSIEDSYPLGDDLMLLKTFHDMGVRMVGPVHFLGNQLADSSTDAKKWNGLSPLGMKFVAEANRLGMVLDASHASDEVLDQLIATSKTPIVLSHSGCRNILDHPRNIDDGHLRKLAASGGVIQINSVSRYTIPTPKVPERDKVKDYVDDEIELKPETVTPERAAQLAAQLTEAYVKYPVRRADFDDFMHMLLHALKIAGVDHVGIGLDWDGGGGVTGMEDVAGVAKITAALKQSGYSDADIAKIWGGNVMRLLYQAEAYAKKVAPA